MPEPASADSATGEPADATPEDDYGGVFGAFPYAFRHSDSRLFRLYVVVGGLLAGLLTVGFAIAFALAIAQSVGLAAGGLSSFVRAFVLFVGFLVVAPLLGPVLFVARHHRRVGNDPRYDRALAVTGFAFAVSLYLAAIVSTPPENQEVVTGMLAPVVRFLYDLPQLSGLVPPVVVAGSMYLVHRAMR